MSCAVLFGPITDNELMSQNLFVSVLQKPQEDNDDPFFHGDGQRLPNTTLSRVRRSFSLSIVSSESLGLECFFGFEAVSDDVDFP